jgi:hypothetical protein
MPVFGFLPGLGVPRNLLDLRSGCNSANIIEKESFNSLTDAALFELPNHSAFSFCLHTSSRFSISPISALRETPNAAAMRCIFTSEMFRNPLSTSPM